VKPTAHAIETVKFAHDMLNKVIAAIPADKALFQIHPTSNHVVWTLGHLATTYAWFQTLFDAKANAGLPDSYNGLFGMGSNPSPDPAKNPPLAEVRAHYDAAFNGFLQRLEALPEPAAWSACEADTGGFASSKLDAAYKCAWHDGWHLGQVSDLRRALKLPGVLG
jgi:DinB superfamily